MNEYLIKNMELEGCFLFWVYLLLCIGGFTLFGLMLLYAAKKRLEDKINEQPWYYRTHQSKKLTLKRKWLYGYLLRKREAIILIIIISIPVAYYIIKTFVYER